MVDQDGGGVFEFAALLFAALRLDFAEVIESLLELAGEARAVEAEACKGLD